MRLRLLGTAAGGGFPQWNCNCVNCRTARTEPMRARPRLQSGAALSADGRHWFLLNASPDVHRQIESFAVLRSGREPRGTAIEGVLLTNADLDHALGLFLLREGGRLIVHATAAVWQSLTEGLALPDVLGCYATVAWRQPPWEPAPLRDAEGRPSGITYAAFPAPGKPTRYQRTCNAPLPGECVGYRFRDDHSGGRLVYLPGVAALDETVMCNLEECDVLLLDGTFWSEDEMQSLGVGSAPASRMGHIPVGGPGGSLARIAALAATRKIYTHINNTNPMLLEDSAERRTVADAGVEVGWDGLEVVL
jgi:pyrroloquinoline quinone biosynthesis protein B